MISRKVVSSQYDKEIENPTKFGDNYLALLSIERSKMVGAGMLVE